ncbi:MAG: type II toxin-antitoxin system mRNA interferase toxin, RelE/StbE family [Clostridia bacterium]|nr:type II toxin-antitoxin system mRNA interferase toxin, RelE/StbE family [Clostridia bacterium]
MIKIYFTDKFIKHYDKLSKKEQTQVDNKITLFRKDITHPSLRTHRMQGYTNRYEFSVNMDIRVIWQYDGNDIIAFVDVGHHDILYK